MRSTLFALLAVLLAGGAASGDSVDAPRGIWFPAAGAPAGVALVVHGLNLKPERMDPLARALARAGIETFRMELEGHGFGSLAKATASEWLAETRAGYRAAAARAAALGVPLYFLGYSFGGLLGEAIINLGGEEKAARFARVVLIAPAIALRPVAGLVKPLFRLGPGFTLPSRDLPDYREHSGTPMAAYEAMFELLKLTDSSGYASANVPTLVFDRRRDELVSIEGLRSLVRKHGLTSWSIVEIANAPAGIPEHLMIDERSLGPAEWERMTAIMLRFLLPGSVSK
jgi:esterase/lipase